MSEAEELRRRPWYGQRLRRCWSRCKFICASVRARVRGEYLRRLSRRTTNAMRQEAHDYGAALGSFVPGACAPAAKMRAVSPVAISSPARFRRGEHASALIIGKHTLAFLCDKSLPGETRGCTGRFKRDRTMLQSSERRK